MKKKARSKRHEPDRPRSSFQPQAASSATAGGAGRVSPPGAGLGVSFDHAAGRFEDAGRDRAHVRSETVHALHARHRAHALRRHGGALCALGAGRLPAHARRDRRRGQRRRRPHQRGRDGGGHAEPARQGHPAAQEAVGTDHRDGGRGRSHAAAASSARGRTRPDRRPAGARLCLAGPGDRSPLHRADVHRGEPRPPVGGGFQAKLEDARRAALGGAPAVGFIALEAGPDVLQAPPRAAGGHRRDSVVSRHAVRHA